jgi:hypothetical protein
VTSFHHQPEAQHPNSSAIHKLAGRLPHLLGAKLPSPERDRKTLMTDVVEKGLVIFGEQ